MYFLPWGIGSDTGDRKIKTLRLAVYSLMALSTPNMFYNKHIFSGLSTSNILLTLNSPSYPKSILPTISEIKSYCTKNLKNEWDTKISS